MTCVTKLTARTIQTWKTYGLWTINKYAITHTNAQTHTTFRNTFLHQPPTHYYTASHLFQIEPTVRLCVSFRIFDPVGPPRYKFTSSCSPFQDVYLQLADPVFNVCCLLTTEFKVIPYDSWKGYSVTFCRLSVCCCCSGLLWENIISQFNFCTVCMLITSNVSLQIHADVI